MKTTIALIAFVTLIAAPTFAADNAPKASYFAKKQGRVAFQTKQEDMKAMPIDYSHVADIEPAAGGFEPKESTLTKSMKLPRK